MKTCPYCAEQIQDAAIKCRYCFSDLTVPPPAAAAAPFETGAVSPSESSPAIPSETPEASGPGAAPASESWSMPAASEEATGSAPVEATPAPAPAWESAPSSTPSAWESTGPRPAPAATDQPASPASAPGAPGPARYPGVAVGEGAIQFSHSGMRYLLGYGTEFFGIWDRQTPGGPTWWFPRTDDGWRQAWAAYYRLEPNNVAVGLGPGR